MANAELGGWGARDTNTVEFIQDSSLKNGHHGVTTLLQLYTQRCDVLLLMVSLFSNP